MSLIEASRFYIDTILGDSALSGMKVLLLDNSTTKAVSSVYSQTQILEKEVFLVERLGKDYETMKHLKCAVFVQPTEANFNFLRSELKNPHFSEYHLFFSNICPQDYVSRLGKADENEVVRQVQEFYCDYISVNDDFFQLGIDNSLSLKGVIGRSAATTQILERNVSGILSVLLALKRRPSQIRFQGHSDVAKQIATVVEARIERDDVFDMRSKSTGPMLLILDRRDDPVTPLLTQWTYQAMVHELLGINNNRVVLRGAPGISKDLHEIVLSVAQDKFFAAQLKSNFGDLGEAVKGLLDDYQRKAKMNENISSLEDMQAFMERFPAFKTHAFNVSKHVALMGELARLTAVYKLLDISALEQEISCSSDQSGHLGRLMAYIKNGSIQMPDKIRLSTLYALRYEKDAIVRDIKTALSQQGASDKQLGTIDCMLAYAGEKHRAGGLFAGGGFMSKLAKSVSTGLSGVENVYTQHTPRLSMVLESILSGKGKLKDASVFPAVAASTSSPTEFVIFMVGGATFEEATAVAEFNEKNPKFKVVLGGSCIHNSTSFTRDCMSAFGQQ